MEFFEALLPWHWIILALVLFAAEALGASGFLIGAAFASLLQGILLFLLPDISWQLQLTMFSFSAIVFSIIYWRYFRAYNQRTDHPMLNDRAAQLIGRTITLDKAIANGEGRIQIGDTSWRVRSDSDLAAGAKVKVVSTEDMVLELAEKL